MMNNQQPANDKRQNVGPGRFFWLILAAIGIAAALILWLSTPWGLDVSHDSIFYLSAAEQLLQGQGLSRVGGSGKAIPLTHFPPFYSLVLALGTALSGMRAIVVARALGALLFGGNVVLGGVFVLELTRNRKAALAAAFLLLLSPVMLESHFKALSEPLYLGMLLAALWLLLKYLEQERRTFFWLSVAASALAYLTRYVGASLVATGALALLVWPGRALRRRLLDAGLYAALGLSPTLLWYLRNILLTGSASNRVLAFHPPIGAQIREGLATLGAWIGPDEIGLKLRMALLGLIGLALGVALVLWMRRARAQAAPENREPRHGVLLLILHAGAYLGLLTLSLTFFDASTPLSNRILIPLYLLLVIVALAMGEWWLKRGPGRLAARLLSPALILFLVWSYLPRSYQEARNMRVEGAGFSSRSWQESELIAVLEAEAFSGPWYSNAAFQVHFLTGEPVYSLPEKFDPVKGAPRPEFDAQFARMRRDLLERGGLLALFKPLSLNPILPSLEELTAGLELVQETGDGRLYRAP